MEIILRWIKSNRLEIIILVVILSLAAFFRFYRLPEYMTFLGDEGRDVIIVKNLLVEHDVPFIGPPTSVGNIYLGPLYYYMMAVPMALFWLNPVAPVVMVALIGVATVFLIYYLARRWFGFLPAILAAVLYALSPVTITYSRSSWNPNPAPFFALLAVLGFYLTHKNKNFLWLILAGASLAAAAQMHYLAVILLPIFSLLWLFALWKKDEDRKYFWIGSIGAVVAFFLLIQPLVLFDFKHNFMNYRALIAIFTQSGGSVGFNLLDTINKIPTIYIDKLIYRYLGGQNYILTLFLAGSILLPILFTIYQLGKKSTVFWPHLALSVWLIVGLLGLSLYKQDIYDHYLGFINPVPYLLLAGLAGFLKGRAQVVLVVLILLIAGIFNLLKVPLWNTPNQQLQRTQEIAKFIISQSENKPFNFALIAQRNYDSAYQFYLDVYGHKPKVVPIEITDQLFVVCEDPVCQPAVNSKYEIASFGMSRIESEFEVSGVKVFKMVHNPTGEPS